MLDANALIGSHDVVLITLDTLRYDVAKELYEQGRTPHLKKILPSGGWEARHTPASFTFAAHSAFFAGFFPTPTAPVAPGSAKHSRLFATKFLGSETTTEQTCVFDAPDIVSGLARRGYHTACIGGTGFFNPATPLGRVLPGLFEGAHWSREMSVVDPRSTEHQVTLALNIIDRTPDKRLFLFINVSALHQPNFFYLPGAQHDSLASHAAALEYVDRELERLFTRLSRRAPSLIVICSDHGTAYGEDGYWGHRVGHSVVWTVPYAEFVLPMASPESAEHA